MEQETKNTQPGRGRAKDTQISETIAIALMTASEEISGSEQWVPRRRSEIVSAIPRLMTIVMAARRKFSAESRSARMIRQSSLRVLAYLPADLRLNCLMDLAVRNPLALDDLLTGPIAPNYEVYRYNIFSSLGIFARHGLVEEVFTKERVDVVGQIVERSRKAAKA